MNIFTSSLVLFVTLSLALPSAAFSAEVAATTTKPVIKKGFCVDILKQQTVINKEIKDQQSNETNKIKKTNNFFKQQTRNQKNILNTLKTDTNKLFARLESRASTEVHKNALKQSKDNTIKMIEERIVSVTTSAKELEDTVQKLLDDRKPVFDNALNNYKTNLQNNAKTAETQCANKADEAKTKTDFTAVNKKYKTSFTSDMTTLGNLDNLIKITEKTHKIKTTDQIQEYKNAVENYKINPSNPTLSSDGARTTPTPTPTPIPTPTPTPVSTPTPTPTPVPTPTPTPTPTPVPTTTPTPTPTSTPVPTPTPTPIPTPITQPEIDLELQSVSVSPEGSAYYISLYLCVKGSKSINDIKATNTNITALPIDYLTYTTDSVPHKTKLSGVSYLDTLKSGGCSNMGTMMYNSDAITRFKNTKKITVTLDEANQIPETNENNNSKTFIGN